MPEEARRLRAELAEARAELEAARRRYFDLFDLAPAGIFTMDRAGLILESNLTAAKQLGVKREVLAKRPLSEFVHEDDRELFREHCRVMESSAAPALELRMLRAGGAPFWARLEHGLGFDADGALLWRVAMNDVSERVRAEKDLRRLRVAVDHAHDGLAVADMNGRIQFVNHAWAREHGYSKEELLGKPLSIFHTARQYETDVLPFNKNVLANGSWAGEVGHVRRDGEVFTRWMSTVLLHDEDDRVAGFVGMTTDLSEQKRREESLSRMLAERQTILKAIPDIFYRLDADFNLMDWNHALERVSGYSPAELKGMNSMEFFKTDRAVAAAAIRETVEKGQVYQDSRFLTKSGEEVPVSWSAAAIRTSDGVLLGLVGVGRLTSEK